MFKRLRKEHERPVHEQLETGERKRYSSHPEPLCLRGRGAHPPSRAMAPKLVSLLSLFLLSATAPTGLYAFTCPHTSIAAFKRPHNADFWLHQLHTPSRGTAAQHRTRQTTDLLAVTSGEASPLTSHEDRLREEGLGGTERTRLAESIGEEFRVRVNEVRQTYDARLEQERASHRLEMAQQRVKLLQVGGRYGCPPDKRRSCLR